jgi:hypothetical protein
MIVHKVALASIDMDDQVALDGKRDTGAVTENPAAIGVGV